MSSLSFYESQHVQRLIQQESSLKYLFDTFVRKSGISMTKWSDTGSSGMWTRNKTVEKEIEKHLAELRSGMIKNINDFSTDAWNRSNLKTDDLVSAYIKDLSITEIVKDGMFVRNEDAFKSFQTRKIDGLNLSDRVWKATGTAKENIEYYLQSGLSTGRPANLISQDVRQLLKNPDRLFHRIRNADGKLVPSAPMAAYHPGQGVYRSSFMNAKRLAVTEVNGAYRSADSERWNRLDFVLGIQVSRSANGGPCDICDALIGKYPKDFKFWGFHPFCICKATPILMNEDDFMSYLTTDKMPPVEFIQDIPADARAYMQDKLDSGKVTLDSYLFKENKSYFK